MNEDHKAQLDSQDHLVHQVHLVQRDLQDLVENVENKDNPVFQVHLVLVANQGHLVLWVLLDQEGKLVRRDSKDKQVQQVQLDPEEKQDLLGHVDQVDPLGLPDHQVHVVNQETKDLLVRQVLEVPLVQLDLRAH